MFRQYSPAKWWFTWCWSSHHHMKHLQLAGISYHLIHWRPKIIRKFRNLQGRFGRTSIQGYLSDKAIEVSYGPATLLWMMADGNHSNLWQFSDWLVIISPDFCYVKHMTTPPQKRRIGEVSGFRNSDEHGHIPKIHVYTAFDVNFQWQWRQKIGVPRLHSVMAETRSAIYEWVKMRDHFWRWGWSWKSSDWQGSSMWLGTVQSTRIGKSQVTLDPHLGYAPNPLGNEPPALPYFAPQNFQHFAGGLFVKLQIFHGERFRQIPETKSQLGSLLCNPPVVFVFPKVMPLESLGDLATLSRIINRHPIDIHRYRHPKLYLLHVKNPEKNPGVNHETNP